MSEGLDKIYQRSPYANCFVYGPKKTPLTESISNVLVQTSIMESIDGERWSVFNILFFSEIYIGIIIKMLFEK